MTGAGLPAALRAGAKRCGRCGKIGNVPDGGPVMPDLRFAA